TAGLTELPENPDIPRLARGCQAGGVGDARFVNTGRSGVPPNPYEPLSSDALVEDTQLPTSWQEDTSEPLVEAQGWTVNDRGQVVLISDSLPAHSNLPCFDR
ncbi:MAG: hypothetical protein J7642_00020, partial [Cyanobacteria bacterium SBC]|nr:hypothetical protein [Cyanobacteria bacterium SBC]